jgi:RsiW-degrading membrane proteinase PrsW (M82 family)
MLSDGVETASRWRWLKLLLLGAAAWLAAVMALAVTHDPNLIPLTVTTGSFAVPVCGAIYVVDRLYDAAIPRAKIAEAFALGGTLGIVLAAMTEYLLVGRGPFQYLGVGFIEEGAKLAALWLVARRLGTYSTRDGIVLGVAVGFGFAAFESSGYALVALFGPHGLDLPDMITTLLERGLLAPVGHGLWTGTLGGALFMTARRGRLRLSRRVVATYVLVALLHALWDSSSGIGSSVVRVLSGNDAGAAWIVVCTLACMMAVSFAGLLAMSRVWRRAVRPSRLPVGSSASSTRGPFASARASN